MHVTQIPQLPVEKIVERIFAFRQIGRLDQHLLMSAMLSKDKIAPSELDRVNEVFDALQRGLLKVVD